MEKWYKEGLCFECTRCGRCCGGAPGEVRVSKAEVTALAKRFAVRESEFISMFAEVTREGQVILRERRNYDCIFYDPRKGCLVYEDRPLQCRTWPFWKSNLTTKEHWEETGLSCPGVNQGKQYSEEQVTKIAAEDGTSGTFRD